MPLVHDLKVEIENLREEVSGLRSENMRILQYIDSQGIGKDPKIKKYAEVVKQNSNPKVKIYKNNVNTPTVSAIKSPTEEETAKHHPEDKSVNTIPSQSKSYVQNTIEDNFIPVRNKRTKRVDKTIVGSGKAEEMSIRGIPKYGYLHVCKLDPSLKPDLIVKHLNTNGFVGVICEKLESKRPKEYLSFKITVPAEDFEAVKNPDLWPTGSRINHFLFRLNRMKTPMIGA
ncbi:uncharacterized protein LOC123308918 [Coccinella septempunctata]|uniref:uncharacterized protein LOC123308918 n=1 Tax=Coccinella septempunctata TaxID=41139 RepID=UPI001D096C06|nr:uncharacterized protein LOC123308918 [Coccinella septempunctata]